MAASEGDGANPAPSKPEEPSSAGAVAESIKEKGENSYYFAHSKPREDLSQAKQIEGDGSALLADVLGGPARVVDEVAEPVDIKPEEKVRWREDYAYGDESGKVKVYLEFPEGALGHRDCKVEARFDKKMFEVVVRGAGGTADVVGVTNGEHELSNEIVPDKCLWRINSSKSRLTITLKKLDEHESWSNLKKKNISQHTGWN